MCTLRCLVKCMSETESLFWECLQMPSQHINRHGLSAGATTKGCWSNSHGSRRNWSFAELHDMSTWNMIHFTFLHCGAQFSWLFPFWCILDLAHSCLESLRSKWYLCAEWKVLAADRSLERGTKKVKVRRLAGVSTNLTFWNVQTRLFGRSWKGQGWKSSGTWNTKQLFGTALVASTKAKSGQGKRTPTTVSAGCCLGGCGACPNFSVTESVSLLGRTRVISRTTAAVSLKLNCQILCYAGPAVVHSGIHLTFGKFVPVSMKGNFIRRTAMNILSLFDTKRQGWTGWFEILTTDVWFKGRQSATSKGAHKAQSAIALKYCILFVRSSFKKWCTPCQVSLSCSSANQFVPLWWNRKMVSRKDWMRTCTSLLCHHVPGHETRTHLAFCSPPLKNSVGHVRQPNQMLFVPSVVTKGTHVRAILLI